MKTIFKTISFVCFIITISIASNVYGGEAGTYSGELLRMPAGARSLAMGEACTAVFEGKAGIYYNPAGLIKRPKLKSMSVTYQRGIAEDNFGIIDYYFSKKSVDFGLGIEYYNAGIVELISYNGEIRNVKSQEDIIGIVSAGSQFFSWNIISQVFWGINVKVIRSTIAEEFSGTSLAADVGCILDKSKYSIGLSIQNISSGIKYDKEKEDLPFTIRSGISWYSKNTNVCIDVSSVKLSTPKLHLGFEYKLQDKYFARCGYKSGYSEGAFSFGFGYIHNKMIIDYGIGLKGVLGQQHLLTVSTAFN